MDYKTGLRDEVLNSRILKVMKRQTETARVEVMNCNDTTLQSSWWSKESWND